MILSFNPEGTDEKDTSNCSAEMAKIAKIEELLSNDNGQIFVEEKIINEELSLQFSKIDFEQITNIPQGYIGKETASSRENDCLPDDIWREIEKSVGKKNQSSSFNHASEDKIINVSSESSSSSNSHISHHSKNFILKSALTGSNDQHNPSGSSHNQMNGGFAFFLSETKNEMHNNINKNQISDVYDIQPLNNLHQYTLAQEDNRPMKQSTYNMPIMKSNHMQMNALSKGLSNNNQQKNNNPHYKSQKALINYDGLPLTELVMKSHIICKEQVGCRYLQKRIDDFPKIANEMFKVVKGMIVELICDSFGNYFIQKIINYLSLEELNEIICGDFATYFKQISLSPHGTRVVQKYLEKIIFSEYLLNIFNILLKPNIIEFAKNPNANHIVIKYVSLIESPRNDFLIHSLNTHLVEIATNKHSCCALQKCVENSNVIQKHLLLMTIAKNSHQLFCDQFGNYVVQFALMFGEQDINDIILKSYLNDFPKYTSHKFASNVYEKCLEYTDNETRQEIIEKLCNIEIIHRLLFDTYGNYILQKTMQKAKEPFRSKYIDLIRPLLDKLQMFPFGHKTYHKMISTFPEFTQFNPFQHKQNQQFPMPQIPQMLSHQHQTTIPIQNNYGNLYYQNNHIYNNMCFQPPNYNVNGYEKNQHRHQTQQSYMQHPTFHYMGQSHMFT